VRERESMCESERERKCVCVREREVLIHTHVLVLVSFFLLFVNFLVFSLLKLNGSFFPLFPYV